MTRAQRFDNHEMEILWSLRHQAGSARCALVSLHDGWRLVLMIDENALQTECCCRVDDAIAVAESWKSRLIALGWRPVEVFHSSEGSVRAVVHSRRG